MLPGRRWKAFAEMAGLFSKMQDLRDQLMANPCGGDSQELAEELSQCCKRSSEVQHNYLASDEQPTATQSVLLGFLEADCIPVSLCSGGMPMDCLLLGLTCGQPPMPNFC